MVDQTDTSAFNLRPVTGPLSTPAQGYVPEDDEAKKFGLKPVDLDPSEFQLKPVKAPGQGESNTLFGSGKSQTFLGDIGAGLQQGTRQVASTLPAMFGLGAQTFESVTGVDTHGLPQAFMQTATDWAEGGAKPGVASIEELTANPMTWVRYTAGTLAESAPFVLSVMSGAGGARMLASLMAKKGVNAATRATILSSIPADVTGAVATASAIEAGATAEELYGAKKQVYPGASLLAGGAKGALESVFPLFLARSMGLTGRQSGELLDRIFSAKTMAGRAGKAALEEGATELAQEEIDIATRHFLDEKYAYLSPEANSRRLNSLVGGAIGGAGFSTLISHSDPQAALDEKRVRDAAGDVPIITGVGKDELPVLGPEAAVDASLTGLDATAGVARAHMLDDLQSSVDLRRRGLFAPAITGTELTFGTQDQALNDGFNAGVNEYFKLDPNLIKRGDVSASVEDLPASLADPRVDFLNDDTLKIATDNLTEAIKWKESAAKARNPQAREDRLAKAATYYRQAMDNGARVEPFQDGMVVIRDQNKQNMLREKVGADALKSQMTKAQLKETRVRPNGSQFYVFTRPNSSRPAKAGSPTVDLERIRPQDVTGLPTQDLSRQVQADQLISRKQDLGRARAKGINFDPKLTTEQQKKLLSDFTRFLQGAGKLKSAFQDMKGDTVEKFMSLVDQGLRLDVTPDSGDFALLNKVGGNILEKNEEIVGPRVTKDKGLSRIVRQRARRSGTVRVSKQAFYQDENVQNAFFATMHRTEIQRYLAGEVIGGTGGQMYSAKGPSPLANVIRELLGPMGIKTDITIEIVAPGSLNGKGVHYDERTIVVTPGGKPQPRSVIQVDPWFYAHRTEGGKLVKGRSHTVRSWAVLTGEKAMPKFFTEEASQAAFFTDVAQATSAIITNYEWERMGTPQQEMLHMAYERERNYVKGTAKDIQLARVIPHPILERTIGEKRGSRKQAYQFEEWLVSNITRWMLNQKTPVGPVEKFFKSVGVKIKSFLNSFSDRYKNKEKPYVLDVNLGEPNQIVADWLTKLQQRGVVHPEEPFLSESTRRSLEASLARNEHNVAGLGLDKYVITYPERASTYRVKLLNKILPKDAHEDRRKIKGLLAMADRHNTMMEWLLGIHQFADLNPHIKGLQTYKSANRAMENTALSWASLADKRLREILKLGKQQVDGLGKFLFDLDQMVYLTKEERENNVSRWPKPDELLALTKKHALSKEAFDTYVQIRQDFLQFMSYLEEVSVKRATETIADPEEAYKESQKIAGEVAQIKNRPYFPHMRFGKYAVTVRDGERKVLHFETFASKADRDRAMVAIEKKYKVPASGTVEEDEISPMLQQWQGLPAFALRNIERALGLDKEEGLTPQQKRDKKLLEAMALQAAPITSFRHQIQERANTPGWSTDWVRTYGSYFARAARYVARQEYTKVLEDSIRDVQKSGSPISRDARTRIASYMTRHYENLMQPAGDWAEARSLAYLWYFAYVPAAAFINLTQVPMVAVPYLASKFGDLKTFGRVTQAYGAASKEYFDELRGKAPIDEGVLSEAIEEAHESRLLDDGFAQELAAISQGSVLQRTIATSKTGRFLRQIAQWGTAPFNLAERMNRSVTFRAAYKMALADNNNKHIDQVMADNAAEVNQLRIDRGWDEPHLRAYMTAADAVRASQFEYSRWAKPKLMEGPRGVMLMFKSYLQNMLFFLFKADRGTQARLLLTMMGVAGLMGLPGADDANELAKWLMRQFGIQWDGERMVRGMMHDWVGDGIAPDIVLHGASRTGFGIPAALNGLGIPSATPDMSGSLSMGKLIPGIGALNPTGNSWKETVGQVTSDVAGPWLGVPFALYQSLMDHNLPADDIKRWERVMPRAMKAMARSSRLMAEQRERDRGGATTVDFDPNDWNDQADMLSIAGGFQPAKLSRQWDYVRAQMEVQNYWKGQRMILGDELFRAKRMKDKEGVQDAIKAIKGFNEEVPSPDLKITGDTLRRSIQTKARNLKLREHGIPTQKSLRGVARQVEPLYPEAQIRRERVPRR